MTSTRRPGRCPTGSTPPRAPSWCRAPGGRTWATPGSSATGPDGTPLPALLGAAALLSVPISDGEDGYGVLTLARQPAEGRFTAADVALATELGRHLGVAIRVDRMFRHRSAVAEALQGSLLPARLPDVPGLELSAAYIPAGENLEVSGDFYDVFPVRTAAGPSSSATSAARDRRPPR